MCLLLLSSNTYKGVSTSTVRQQLQLFVSLSQSRESCHKFLELNTDNTIYLKRIDETIPLQNKVINIIVSPQLTIALVTDLMTRYIHALRDL